MRPSVITLLKFGKSLLKQVYDRGDSDKLLHPSVALLKPHPDAYHNSRRLDSITSKSIEISNNYSFNSLKTAMGIVAEEDRLN
ncbi:10430_t:CDS:2 [Entrophospora sp. SA101]|nr:16421_t:CDS:2 [Entrophospora sp. SA101]CAJ0643505.1 16422_t:CDS:2 [Entrophospora sp. SA101]CAJ0765469.1 6785_t:CDS:2 [Entrophospora sp. SA101]CAJ0767055.1 10430_t:CDS:2 [Entrophospora sp. SA101]CAJ0836302.1 17633_t:CDS:2 [Entrophospora sp. SA101]